jgi:hypothetical protein
VIEQALPAHPQLLLGEAPVGDLGLELDVLLRQVARALGDALLELVAGTDERLLRRVLRGDACTIQMGSKMSAGSIARPKRGRESACRHGSAALARQVPPLTGRRRAEARRRVAGEQRRAAADELPGVAEELLELMVAAEQALPIGDAGRGVEDRRELAAVVRDCARRPGGPRRSRSPSPVARGSPPSRRPGPEPRPSLLQLELG